MLVKEASWLAAADWQKMYPDVEARLGEIKAPTLMIISGRETVLLPDDQWRTVRQIPGAKAVFFEDEGHLIILENIRRVAREMIARGEGGRIINISSAVGEVANSIFRSVLSPLPNVLG